MKPKRAKHFLAIVACAGLTLAGMMAYSPDAEACGGLFCNQSQPVNQAAERIIFSDNPDGTVTAVVQIMYQGPSEKFAWVLPVSSAPEVEVSSGQALDRMQTATNPVYNVNTRVEGQCANGNGRFAADSSAGAEGNGGGGGNEPGAGGVTVVSSGNVGPYNHTTISVDPNTANPEQAALDWLDQNGYDISALAPDLIRDYLEAGMNLLAVKLNKNSESGDIRPIHINYDAEVPMIPIKLTAVAANDDMGVLVWVLGEHRAIPTKYKSLELNQAAINWFNPSSNYNDVVTMAANEADGQGFVTEYAAPVDQPVNTQFRSFNLRETIFTQFDEQNWNRIETTDWSNREGDLLEASAQFAQWDGYQQVVDDHVPLTNMTAEEFAQCVGCSDLVQQSDIQDFDPATFISQLDEQVVGPMEETQALFEERAYVTRLYTTMSAEEMTIDPVFDFNAGLGNKSNFHQAEQVIECTPDYTRNEAPWRMHLPQGDTIYGVGQNWPVSAEDDDMPATRLIVNENTSGEGEVVEDNTAIINDAIQRNNDRVTDDVSGGLACSSSPTGSTFADLALIFAAMGFSLVFWRRREG